MTAAILITFCILLLLAYFFDITSPKTNIPAVILLLISGWLVKQVSILFDFSIPDLTPLLPVLGTMGLILIVLEGSLELEINPSKIRLVKDAFLISLLSILTLTFLLSLVLQKFTGQSFRICLINAVPICIISSAIAISSAKNLSEHPREFVTYESSLSDIFGVLLFNFVILNEGFSWFAVGRFSIQLLLIILISFISTLGLAFLLNRINHRVKFAPLILLIVLIYEVSKVYHLPSLVFILLFGLIIGNIDEFKQVKWIQKLKPQALNKEVHKFRDLVIEATFLVRSVFFLLFGYLVETAEIINGETFLWALAIVIAIFLIRYLYLKLLSLPLKPLLFFAPRGLITILLFLAIHDQDRLTIINRSLITQIIILTALVMILGMVITKRTNKAAP